MDAQAKHLLDLGRSHYQREEYDAAERALSQVIAQSQSFADAYQMLGVIHYQRGRLALARKAFEAALRINPAYTEAALNLAVIYNDMGRYGEAREVYDRALRRAAEAPGRLDPVVSAKVANMYADIGDVFSTNGLWDAAVAEYRRALELAPDFVDIRVKLAAALRDRGDKEAAVHELERVIGTRPDFLGGRVALGLALYSAGRREAAVAQWEGVLARAPEHRAARMYLDLVRDRPAPGGSEHAGTQAAEPVSGAGSPADLDLRD